MIRAAARSGTLDRRSCLNLCALLFFNGCGSSSGRGNRISLITEGDNASYVLIMWSRIGSASAKADLQELMERSPELWSRLVKGYLDPFGELRLKELASVFDVPWLRQLGESHRVYLQTDPAALRVLESLARVLDTENPGESLLVGPDNEERIPSSPIAE